MRPLPRPVAGTGAKTIDCGRGPIAGVGATGMDVTWNMRVTSAAAAYGESPPCNAVTEHVTAAKSDTPEPEAVQTAGVETARLTASPLEALALRFTGPPSIRLSTGCWNVIVCAVGVSAGGAGAGGVIVTANDLETDGAAAYVASPPCDAVIMHVPAATS